MAIPANATAGAALRSAHTQSDAVVIEAHGGEAFVPGPPGFIVGADYARSGWDLKLADKDGHEAVIKDFFKLEHPPELVSPEGAHIPAELAMKLAGPLAPGQYAQAAPGAGSVPIGQVQTVQGAATATHTDGTKVALAVGTPIFQGDILETGRGGSMGVVFVDKTTFAMQDESRMVIDRLIFDPGSKQGSQVFSLLQGAFVAVTGEIAQTNPQAVTVNTPVAAIGIRGTEFAVVISQQLGQTLFTLMAGAISISNALGQVVLNTAGLTTLATNFNAPPAPPFTLPQAQFNTLYGAGAAITEQLRPFGVRPQQQQQQQNQNQPNPNELQQVQSSEPAAGQDQQGQAGANKTFGASKVFGDVVGLTDLQIANGLGLGPDSGFKFGESNPLDFIGEGGDRHQLFFIVEETAAHGPQTIEILPGNNPGQAIVRDGTEIIVDSPNEIPAIIGSSGNDTLIVHDLSGTAFANSVIFFFGNGGDDTLSAEQATNPIVADGGPGNDVFNSGSGNDTLTGGLGVDTLSGGAGNDLFIWHAGDGNDIIHGGSGTDQLALAAGPLLGTVFTINPDNAGGTFTVTAATDTLFETVQADSVEQIVVVGGAGADVLNGAATHHDVLATGAGGNDTLTTGFGNDVLDGGPGDDILNAGPGNDVLIWNAGEGNDTVDGGVGADQLELIADPVSATSFTVSALVAGAFTASDGTDTVQAQGIEQIIMFGGAGADTLDAAATSLDVTASGGAGNDVLTTGSGDDRFIWQVGDGNDLLQGGAGTDVLEVDSDPAGTTFTVSGTNNNGTFTVDDGVSTITANGVEQVDVVGGAGIDIVDAAQADVTIRAFGGGGADTITTGSASDLLAGDAGADVMTGGDGDDIYIVDNAGDDVIEHPNGGTDTVLSSIDYTLGNNVENLGLGAGDLVGTGNSLNNIIGVFDVNTLLGLGSGSGGGSGGGVIAAGFDSNVLPANDDGSTGAISIGFTVDFFGQAYDNLYVNNNGDVTFTSPLGTFTPFGLGAQYIGQPIIAPFFADVDTRGFGSGVVSYGTGTFDGHLAFGVNWPLVGYYSSGTDKLNDFQLILVDRSDVAAGDFDIYFNYDQVQWETGSASGGIGGLGGTSAAVGYALGTGEPGTFYELPGSLIPGSLIDGGTDALTANTNDGFTGQYLFQVRSGDVTQNDVGIPGDKILYGLAGNDTLSGGIGNDTLDGGSDNDSLDGGSGNDVLIGGTGADTMQGGDGNDVFVWNAGDGSDLISGNSGSDVVELHTNNSNTQVTVTTVGGVTTAVVSTGGSIVMDGVEALHIFGGNGADVVNGSAAGISLIVDGGLGDDTMSGGSADDTFIWHPGDSSASTDLVDGGGDVGGDALIVDGAGTAGLDVEISLGHFVATNAGVDSAVSFTNIESLVFQGTANDDALTFTHASGADVTFQGGGGWDRVDVFVEDDSLTVTGGVGSATVSDVDESQTVFGDSVEELRFISFGNTTVSLDGLDDSGLTKFTFDGESSSQAVLDGANGGIAIEVTGGIGNDTFVGGTGVDTLSSGDGADLLVGGHGSDTLEGGTGADVFHYDDPGNIAGAQNGDGFIITTNRVKTAGENGDFIVGFQSGTDQIDFGINFGLEGNFFSTIAGPYDGTNAGANQQWSAGQAALIYSTADHTLYYDANGAAGGYQVVATVQSGDAIQATDVTAAVAT